jgi:hypothetical protein
MVAAIFALLGTVIGATVTLLAERLRAQAETDRQRLVALRSACSEFSTTLIRIRHLSLRIRDGAVDSADLEARIRGLYEDAWGNFERVRLLSNSATTQKAGRYAIRHAWAVWQIAATGKDPRGEEYPNDPPLDRFNRALHDLHIESRRELGMKQPDAVFGELPA